MSSKPIIQDGEEIREMTAAEYLEYQELQIEVANFEAAQVVKATARQALLEKLGITEEEAQLLLGGN